MTNSLERIDVEDGRYNGTRTGFILTILRPKLKNGNKGHNGGLIFNCQVTKDIGVGVSRVKLEVINGIAYVNLSDKEGREIILSNLLYENTL